MTTTISAQKVGDPLHEGRRLLGDRWTSAFVGDHLWFISLNGINQPSYHAFHETPLFGGVVTAFDVRQRQWTKKEIVYESLSSEENLEGRVFGFRHTLLLLTYRKHGGFSYQGLFYWEQSQNGWQLNSLYIDPKTQVAHVQETELILAESDDSVYLVTHDRSHGTLVVSQMDTVGGYGKPGPARIDFLFHIQNNALKGETASVCSVGVFDHRLWTLFFGHDDPAGAAVRLLSTRIKDGKTEEIDLNAVSGSSGSVLTKPFLGTSAGDPGAQSRCRLCNRPDPKKMTFIQGLCGSQWVFLTNGADDPSDRELWSIDLREGRWRLLAASEKSRDAWSRNNTRISIPSDVEMAAWNDADMEFFGISFEAGIYMVDVKRIVDEF